MSVRPLPEHLLEKAKAELNEDPKLLADGIAYLKEWLAKQPHLKARTDDQWLAAFLRGCKYSLERTKEKIDLYYSMRSLAPEFFKVNINHPKFMEIHKLGIGVILPKSPNPTDPLTMVIRSGKYDPDKYSITDIMAVNYAKQQIMQLENDQFIVCGGQSIVDLEGVTMGHLSQITPMVMKKMAALGQDAAPIRMKGVHFLNTPTGFETVYNLMKSLFNEKNRNRMKVHNKNYEAMYQYIPKDILPAEYGGNGGTIDEITDYWTKKFEEYRPWLEEDLQYGTDESKRPGKPKTSEDMFGVEGSFRQLQYD